MKHTPSQKLMLADGAPSALFIAPERRAKAWAGRPLTVVTFAQVKTTRNEDEATVAFRAREDERKRMKSLAGIARMKQRFVSKAIDHSKMRWDPKRSKFVEDTIVTGPEPTQQQRSLNATLNMIERDRTQIAAKKSESRANSFKRDDTGYDWSRVTKDRARELAELNGVWDDKYVKLSGGLLVMTVTNRLKGLVKKGGEVRWS